MTVGLTVTHRRYVTYADAHSAATVLAEPVVVVTATGTVVVPPPAG